MTFENLEVWKRGRSLCALIYLHFKESRDHGFKDQICRSVLSEPSNIAEGYERLSKKEMIQFISYAKGSCGELKTQIYIGMDIGYIEKETGEDWLNESTQLSKMIGGLIKSIKTSIDK
jgi:four helix bundle protein